MKNIIAILSILSIFINPVLSNETINKVIDNLDNVDSYTADIKIVVDISFVDIPDKNGKIYYKSPGKLKADIPGLAMLPKQGLGIDYKKILQDETNTYIDGGDDNLNGKPAKIVKAIPSNPDSKIVLTSFWVDPSNYTIIQAEVTTKQNGTFLIELEHEKISDVAWLPSKVVINARVPKLAIPKSFVSAKDKKKLENEEEDPDSATTKGVITLTYSNYVVNKDIEDSVFDD